jgi:hypothetical protein
VYVFLRYWHYIRSCNGSQDLECIISSTVYPVRVFEYIGYIGWCSTLGVVGWEIQTHGGNTPSERLNQNLAKIFSVIGIFAFVLARELIPFS